MVKLGKEIKSQTVLMKKGKTAKEIQDYLNKNWLTKNSAELSAWIGKSETQVRRYARKMGLPQKNGGGHNAIVLKESKSDSLKDKIFQFLLKAKRHNTYEQLSDKFDVGVGKIKSIVSELKAEHKNFDFHDDGVGMKETIEKSQPTIIDSKHLIGKRIKFGFVTDNHLGSKYERLDVLNAVYERFKQEGITDVYNAGNVIDGEARFNKFDIHKYGMQAQCDYFAEVYPRIDGMTTHFITGDDHEGWYVQREGVNIGKFMEQCARNAGRDDLKYLGHMEHDIIFKTKGGQAVMRIVHPGGGSSYAYSYTSQKIVESYTPGEKPHIVLGGHYHKACYNYIRGVHFLQGGTTMDQSPFMRKKRLEAHVGGWIVEIQQGENGVIQSFQCEWIPFYGREFYEKDSLWQYQY